VTSHIHFSVCHLNIGTQRLQPIVGICTPKGIIGKLNAAAVGALADPAVQSRITDLGMDIPPREQ
jgi:hypothetical protein